MRFSMCMARTAAAAVLASGLTYGGVTLTTPAPTLVSATTIPPCQGIAGEPPTAAGCVYWNDVYGDPTLYPQLPNFASASKGLCYAIKYDPGGAKDAAAGLVFSWSTNQKYMITLNQADKYVNYVQSSGVCDQPGY